MARRPQSRQRPDVIRTRFHYAFVVIGITFAALLVAAGLRSAPGVLIRPIELHFGWDRTTVSTAAAFGIFFYGLVGPFAAALMQSFGIKRTLVGGLILMSAATLGSLGMSEPWHFIISWGVISGIGSGAVAPVLGAAIVNRWFATRQGLMIGILTASTATGSLIFLPLMAWMSASGAWRPVVMLVGAGAMIVIPLVLLFMPERPSDIGLRRYGADHDAARPAPSQRPWLLAVDVLAQAARTPMFWLLFGTFFVCGLTTNGLVGTHLIAYCGDFGIAPVAAASLLSLMGLFDLVGTTASGWLADRFDPRKLLFVYYGLRGLSLIALPFLDFGPQALSIFAIIYGLDWVATVPPTVKLTNQSFGEDIAPIVFGWTMAGHQLGAATAALAAGVIREQTGTYMPAFIAAGIFGLMASAAFILSGRVVPRLAPAE